MIRALVNIIAEALIMAENGDGSRLLAAHQAAQELAMAGIDYAAALFEAIQEGRRQYREAA